MGHSSHTGTFSLLTQWGMRDPAAATEYLGQLDNPQTRTGAVVGLAKGIAMGNGVDVGLAWATKLPANERSVAFSTIVGHTGGSGVRPFLDFIGSMPDQDGQIELATLLGTNLFIRKGDVEYISDWALEQREPVAKLITDKIQHLIK